MPARPIRISVSLLLVILVLGLAACVRPVPGQEAPPTATPAVAPPTAPIQPEGGDTGIIIQPTPEQPAEQPVVVPQDPTLPNSGYPTDEQPPAPPEGESPRPEDGGGEAIVITPEEGQTVDNVVQQPQEPQAPVVVQPVPPTAGTGGNASWVVGQRPTEPLVHTVQPGENLFRIGLMYGYSWVVLQQYNGLPNANFVAVGQQIRIPGTSGTGGVAPDQIPPSGTYVVQAGDTLFRIGQRFGVDWRLIAEANGIVNPNRIYVGQVLKIPATAVPLPGTSGSTDTPGIGGAGDITHVVQAGETLFAVALRYGVPWPYIAQSNGLEAPFALYEGQSLIISGSN